MIRKFFTFCGVILVFYILLAFTPAPYWGYNWLGNSKSGAIGSPATIVVMGGGGMPSNSGLMRSWYTQKAAEKFPHANILIAMPGDLTDSSSTPRLMKKELIIRGVPENKILFENNGTNTRSQALESAKLLPTNQPIVIVTSPGHMRRAVLSFKKVEFTKVAGLPTFEKTVEANLSFDTDSLGGRKTVAPDVGSNTTIRYQLWDYLKYELLITRELVALVYYWLKGWI